MTNKKLLWILIPLSILLGGFSTLYLVTPRFVEMSNVLHGDANIQNARYRTGKFKELQVHLDNEEIEEVRKLISLLYGVDIHHLEIMRDGEGYPKQINLRAKKALAEIKSGSESNTPKDEHQSESSN